MLVFIDTEFTNFPDSEHPNPQLISIGCVTEGGQTFYAENANFDMAICSEFVMETVLPFLEGGEVSIPYCIIAKHFKTWIESIGEEAFMATDSPAFDFGFVEVLFKKYGWPENLYRRPINLNLMHLRELESYESQLEALKASGKFRDHHALDDAKMNLEAYKKI